MQFVVFIVTRQSYRNSGVETWLRKGSGWRTNHSGEGGMEVYPLYKRSVE